MKTLTTILGTLLLIALSTVVLGAYAFWSSAFILTHLWAWFIVAPFGLPALGFYQAMGLAVLVGYMTHQHITIPIKDEREAKEKITEVICALLRPWLALLCGYFIHLLILKNSVGV